MSVTVVIELFVIFLLILLNGFFALSEIAIVSARRPRLRQMAQEGHKGAERALSLAEDAGSFLASVQIGITLIGILAGAYGGATLAEHLARWLKPSPYVGDIAEPLSIAIVVIAVTYVSLIAGELVPKRIALNNAEAIAAAVARPMSLLATLAAPAVWFLRVSSDAIMRLGGLPMQRQVTVTAEEVKSLIDEGTEAGVFVAAERDMVEGVLRLTERPVRAIMTPRVDIVWLDAAMSVEDMRKRIQESGHSRFPVSVGGSIDVIEGVVHTKDILDRILDGKPLDLSEAMQTPLSVHDNTPVLRLIELFRSQPIHMALVVDEYGAIQGIVTAADVLAAIAGAFAEPSDTDEGPPIVRRDDGSWLVDGMVGIEEAERVLGCPRMRQEDDDFHTIAGFVLYRLGHVPRTGEHFVWRDLRFEVVDMDGRRIDKLLISAVAEDDPRPKSG
ncbi:MAG: hemolysin family protein [Rhodospirillales bacterium]